MAEMCLLQLWDQAVKQESRRYLCQYSAGLDPAPVKYPFWGISIAEVMGLLFPGGV